MTIKRDQLLQELESVQPGLSPRELVEQSSCFVFTGKRVHTFNDEICCSAPSCLPIQGAIEATLLLGFLRSLNDSELKVRSTEKELQVRGKKKRAGIALDPKIQLPMESVEQPGAWQKLPDYYGEAVGMVVKCAAKDIEESFVVNCVHITPGWIEAFDNFQASRYSVKVKCKPCLVRHDAIGHISQLGMSQFAETPNWVHFRNSNDLVVSCRRFPDSSFPDLTKLFKPEGAKLKLPAAVKAAALRAELFTRHNEDSLIECDLQSGKATIRGKGFEGWFEEVQPAEYDGPHIRFMIDAALIGDLAERGTDMVINQRAIHLQSDPFEFVTMLGVAK